MRRSIDRWRLYAFMGATLALLSIVGYRVFTVAYLRHVWYSAAARSHLEGNQNILARGSVYVTDRDGERYVVATNQRFPLLTLNAAQVQPSERGAVLRILEQEVGIELGVAEAFLSNERDLEIPIGGYLSEEQAAHIVSLSLGGVDVIYQVDRAYPDGFLAADVVGFYGYDPDGRHGQYGVEAYYERELAGQMKGSSLVSAQSLIQRVMALIGRGDDARSIKTTPLPVPSDVVLTIDRNVQAFVQDALTRVIEQFGGAAGSVVVQEITSGKIIAMADSPSFDPNRYGSAPTNAFLNAPTQRSFEPGSSFKPFTMAMGLDSSAVTPDTPFTDTGSLYVAGHTIRNFTDEPFGTVTMTGVLEKSINTGTMFVARKVGTETFLKYIINFGFGQRTDIDLPGEATGNIENLYSGREINYLTASFGQGITVTPLQLAVGYSTIANDGKMMRPYVVDHLIHDGVPTESTEPEVIGIPIKPKTSAQLRDMLTSVVDHGFDKARIARYDVAGKTGTAQIAGPEGSYLEEEYIHSFAGFLPSTSPQYTIVIVLERPKGVTFASDSLSPVFKEIAEFLINYYRIPPTR